jgi:hypothetical protein
MVRTSSKNRPWRRPGPDPSTRLEIYRGAILALTVRSIGEGSQLTVKSASNGTPVFVKKAERNSAAAPPMRQTGRPAATARHQNKPISEGVALTVFRRIRQQSDLGRSCGKLARPRARVGQ